MIEVGMKVVGNWGAGAVLYGVVTYIYEFRGREQVVVDFDGLDGLAEFGEDEFLFADSISKVGVYIDHEGMV